MEKSLSDLSKLQSLINAEYDKYTQAIMENKQLADVKIIYIHIKELRNEFNQVTKRIHKKLEHKNLN